MQSGCRTFRAPARHRRCGILAAVVYSLGDSGLPLEVDWSSGGLGVWGDPHASFPVLLPDWEQRSAPHLGGLAIRGGEAQEHRR